MATVTSTMKRQILMVRITLVTRVFFCIDEVAYHELPKRIAILFLMLFEMRDKIWNLFDFAAEIRRNHPLSKEQYRKKYGCHRFHVSQK